MFSGVRSMFKGGQFSPEKRPEAGKERVQAPLRQHSRNVQLVFRSVVAYRLFNDYNWVFPLILCTSALGYEVMAIQVLPLIS